jgi:uncharacterized protein (TIGR03663 family)
MAAIPRETPDYRAPTVLDRRLDFTWVNLEVVAFVGLVLLSIVAHLWALGHMALHHDESIHAWSSWRFFTGAGAFTCAGGRPANTYCYDPVFHGPSLYSLTMFSYLLFGVGDAQARLPEALAGIGLVASAWMLRPYFGRRGTLIAAALLAFTPALLYYTRFARHDGLMVLWEFWMVLGFFRWLDTGRARYLYLLAAGAALAIATHELYYILFFLFGSFVLIRVLSELLPARKLTIGMIALLVVALVISLADPPITEKLRAGGLTLLLATVVGAGLLMMRVWDTTPTLTARALVLWRRRRGELWAALGILGTIYVLLYSTYFADPRGILDGLYQGISYWLGTQHDYARGDQPWYYYLMLVPIYEPLALLTSLGAAIYLFGRRPTTDDRRPTTDDRRPTTDDIAAAEGEEEAESSAAAVEADTAPDSNGAADVALSEPHPFTPSPLHPFTTALLPLFLAFWFIGVFVAFSWAGEKMPWLLTHIALPGNLLAAWAIGRLIDYISRMLGSDAPPEIQNQRSKILLIPPAAALLLVFMGVAIWRLFSAGEGQEGQADLLQGLIPLLVAGALIYAVLTIAQSAGARLTLALSALTVVGILTIYEVHSTWMVVYDHPDTPREPLIFVQSSPDVPLISQDIHELAISQTRNQRSVADPIGGYTMPIIMDIGDEQGEYSLGWPFYWYFRDMQRLEGRKADFFQNATAESFQVPVDSQQPDGEKEFAPVVMVSVPHITEATRQALEANYVKRYSSNLNWWFPYGNKCDGQAPGYSRFYYSTWTPEAALAQPSPKGCGPTTLPPDQFVESLHLNPPWGVLTWPLEPANWKDTWRFLLYRDLPDPLQISGREMEVWVRRDLAGGAAGPASTASGGSALKLVAEQVIGEPGQLEQPHGLAVDSKGNVYVADSAKHHVVVFGPDGKLLREIGSFGAGPGQFNEPHGLAVDKSGNLYVADTWNARVDKFDPNGAFLKSWGTGQPDQSGRLLTMTDGTEAGNAATPLGFYGPRGVAVDEQGNVYITDTGNKRIVVTDAEGNFKYQWGSAGPGPGQFSEPIGLALDGQGNLYVGDTWNSRVQVFGRDQQGQLSPVPLVTWNVSGWQAGTYHDPFVGVSQGGQVYVTVPGRDTVLYANLRGDVLLRWGGKGSDSASVTEPSGIAVGADGAVYVVDYGGMRVLKFTLPNVADPQAGR